MIVVDMNFESYCHSCEFFCQDLLVSGVSPPTDDQKKYVIHLSCSRAEFCSHFAKNLEELSEKSDLLQRIMDHNEYMERISKQKPFLIG